jgi:hypothetical protein
VKAKDKIEEIAVKDIAELVLESVRPPAMPMTEQPTPENSPVL